MLSTGQRKEVARKGWLKHFIRLAIHLKESSEMLALLINIWVNPLIFDATPEETLNRCILLSEMMSGYNLNIIDDELKNKLETLTLIENRKR